MRRRLRNDFRLQNRDYIIHAALFLAAETWRYLHLHLHRRHQPPSCAAIGIMFTSRDLPPPFTPTSCREMGLDDLLKLLTEFLTRDIPTLKLSNVDKCVVLLAIITGYIV